MEYYPFLRACEAYNCTVHLANENITIKPHDDDLIRHVKEAIYFQIAETPQIVEQYIKYLLNKESMSWDSMHEIRTSKNRAKIKRALWAHC